MRLVRHTTRQGRHYRVYRDGVRWLVRTGDGNFVQSVVLPAGWRTGFYYDEAGDALSRHRDILILGNGAGSVARYLNAPGAPKRNVIGVEPDPEMNNICAFIGTSSDCAIVRESAQSFLCRALAEGRRYQGIFVDCYIDAMRAPEFDAIVSASRAALEYGGSLVVNEYDGHSNTVTVERK